MRRSAALWWLQMILQVFSWPSITLSSINTDLCQCIASLLCLFWYRCVWNSSCTPNAQFALVLTLFAGLASDCILSYRQKAAEWSSDDETKELNAVAPALTPAEHVQTEGPAPAPCHSYKKSLRLSSDQIVRQVIADSGSVTKIKQRQKLSHQSAVSLIMFTEAPWKRRASIYFVYKTVVRSHHWLPAAPSKLLYFPLFCQ